MEKNYSFKVWSVDVNMRITDKVVEIEIPGTNAFQDLAVTLLCVPDKEGKHMGCNSIAKRIFKKLNNYDEFLYSAFNGKPITVRGHSMGGSIVECLHYIIMKKHSKMCFTKNYCGYGVMPRNANTRIDRQIRRIRVGRDFVPYLFPWFVCKPRVHLTGCTGPWPIRWLKDHKYKGWTDLS